MPGNWSYNEVRRAVTNALAVDKDPSISLDVSRSDARNIKDIVRWANEMGYRASEDEASESVTVTPIKEGDPDDKLPYEAAERRNELLKAWFAHDDEAFETAVRISSQKTARRKRRLDMSDPQVRTAFYLGHMDGCNELLLELLRDRIRRKIIRERLDEAGPVMARILLYLHGKDKPVLHTEMAEELGMPYEELTEAMIPPLASYAATAYGTGRNTRYELTPAGRRFCEDTLPDDGNETHN